MTARRSRTVKAEMDAPPGLLIQPDDPEPHKYDLVIDLQDHGQHWLKQARMAQYHARMAAFKKRKADKVAGERKKRGDSH